MPIGLIKKLDRGRDSVAGGDGQQTLRLPMRSKMMIVMMIMMVIMMMMMICTKGHGAVAHSGKARFSH